MNYILIEYLEITEGVKTKRNELINKINQLRDELKDEESTKFIKVYQEVNDQGIISRMVDMDGNTIELPAVTESRVIDDNPPTPTWV